MRATITLNLPDPLAVGRDMRQRDEITSAGDIQVKNEDGLLIIGTGDTVLAVYERRHVVNIHLEHDKPDETEPVAYAATKVNEHLQAINAEWERRAEADRRDAAELQAWSQNAGSFAHLITAVRAAEEYLHSAGGDTTTRAAVNGFLQDIRNTANASIKRAPTTQPANPFPGWDHAGKLPEPADGHTDTAERLASEIYHHAA